MDLHSVGVDMMNLDKVDVVRACASLNPGGRMRRDYDLRLCQVADCQLRSG